MKEVTRWDNNPRMMWVWNKGYKDVKHRLLVVYIVDKVCIGQRRVCVIDTEHNTLEWYDCCAEIIESVKRMTYKQLSRWLREKQGREYKDGGGYVSPYLSYKEDKCDEEVPAYIVIRENDGEWREPIIGGEE